MSTGLGYPRLAAVVREALVSATRARVPSLLVAILVAAVCVTTLATVGRANAAEVQVAERMDSAGARNLTVTDTSETYLTPIVMDQVAGLSVVERSIGLGPTVDATNAALGRGATPRAAYRVTAGLPGLCALTYGREPRAGEALVSESAMADLGFATPFGAIQTTEGQTHAVVGACALRDPYGDLDGVYVFDPGATRTLALVTTSAADAARAQHEVLVLISADDPAKLQVTSPLTLAQVRGDVVGDLSAFGQGLLILVLGAGTFLVAVVVLADTLVRRSDLGRRRALGAPRWAVTSIVVVRTLAAGVVGALVGSVGAFIGLRTSGYPVGGEFTVAIALLAVLAAVLGSLVPAIAAAWQDSVRVLRTP